jgi:hypothetical protein
VITGAEVGDINADGSPEIYVYVTDHGADARASLVVYSAANNRKSLSEIYLPPLDGTANAKGYQGHDKIAMVETVVARRFPIYGAGDPPAPTGRTRQLQYKLKPGEPGWALTLDKVKAHAEASPSRCFTANSSSGDSTSVFRPRTAK